jgi:glycosyltransferase involved in cell wall biosynthesis
VHGYSVPRLPGENPLALVMIESMATGTPVVGMALGSVPEVIAHGKTGYVCGSLETDD